MELYDCDFFVWGDITFLSRYVYIYYVHVYKMLFLYVIVIEDLFCLLHIQSIVVGQEYI